MTYYAQINSKNILVGVGTAPMLADEYGSNDVQNIEVSEEVFSNAQTYGINYYLFKNNKIIKNSNYEQEQAELLLEQKAQMTLTPADVERALYEAKGIDFDDLKEQIKDIDGIDIKRIGIELRANLFYRGSEFVDKIGALLGYSSEDMDYLFENKKLP